MDRYILITGGEFYNKGAQAMTLITIDKMRQKYPDRKIILFSGLDSKRSSSEKDNYRFEVLPFPHFGETMSLMTGLLKNKYFNNENGKSYSRYREIFKNADLLIDISGYALGSSWGDSTNHAYLRRIMLAKHFRIPVYIMPQSLGPFEYTGRGGAVLNILIKHYLKYPRVIMAREQDGFDSLKSKYELKNVIKTPDLVLQNTDIDLNNIFKNPIDTNGIEIKNGSVAIIPNSKNNKFGNQDELLELYKDIINVLLSKGKTVYLMYHAVEDLAICKKIKSMFDNNESVTVIEKELNCIEFENTVKHFDFVIASRYHSIVHAYKQGVPAIVFGWAMKYRELTEMYSQQNFCFDVRCDIDKGKVLDAVAYLSEKCTDISENIKTVTCQIQKNNVFDFVNI